MDYELSFAALVAIVSLVAIISLAVLFSQMNQEQLEAQRLAEFAMQEQDIQPAVDIVDEVTMPLCEHRYTLQKSCEINHYKQECVQCKWTDGSVYWDVLV